MRSEPRGPDTPFCVEPDSVDGGSLRLSAEESHHLLHVFRAVPGTPFEAVDGEGRLYICELAGVEGRLATGRVLAVQEGAGELPGTLELIVGLPDFASAEALMTRAVPLGLHRIVFTQTEQSERWRATGARRGRLSRLARAAVKQSRRTRLPRIEFPDDLERAVEPGGDPGGRRFLADPSGRPWSEGVLSGVFKHATLAVGPPGGLSERERALFRERGFASISLGNNRLRTEDASCALLTLARDRILTIGAAGH